MKNNKASSLGSEKATGPIDPQAEPLTQTLIEGRKKPTMLNLLKSKPVAASLLAGGVVLGGFASVSAVSAQTADEDPTTENGTTVDGTTEDGERSERNGRRGRGEGCGKSLDAAAEAIGIEADELKAALEEGQSIAEVAEANGVDADVVVDALVANAEARIDEKVAEGRLTDDEAAEKLAEKTERIEARVDGEELPDRGDRDGDTDSDADSDADSTEGTDTDTVDA